METSPVMMKSSLHHCDGHITFAHCILLCLPQMEHHFITRMVTHLRMCRKVLRLKACVKTQCHSELVAMPHQMENDQDTCFKLLN